MPKTLLHGQSIDVTYAKYPVLRLAIRTSLQAYKQALRKLYNGRPPPSFFYIDLNAGSGYNDEACCPGSPLAAIDELVQQGCTNYRAVLCDKDRGQIERVSAAV